MERNTVYGPVIGVDDSARSGALAWKGLPYAKPPTGERRWRAPQEPDCWKAPRAARQFANASVQTGRLYGPGPNNRYDRSIGTSIGSTVGSEDCLYLNVWAPACLPGKLAADPAGLLPVIVFVHGGSNILGYTADPMYEGSALAVHANAVVVTLNYRLGIFGFLNLAQLKEGRDRADDSGNFALLDILQALKFINRNIANFGGDPGNVTLMGQSAGAFNVWSLLCSPLMLAARPALVQRALPISGGLSLAADMPPGRLPALQPVAVHAAQGQALLAGALMDAGVAADQDAAQAWVQAHSAPEVAAWLRARSADSLLGTVSARLAPRGLAASGPIPEGTVLPCDPVAAIRAGHYLKVPLLAGITRDEGKLFSALLAISPALGGVTGRRMDDAQVFAQQFDYRPDAPPQTSVAEWIPAQYLPVDQPGTGYNARTEQFNQMLFAANRDLLLDVMRTQQEQVWHYRFDWDEEPAPFDAIYGAAHGFDLPFIFGNFGPSVFSGVMASRANQPGRLALSAAMMNCVAAFARHGDPNHAKLGVDWPVWPAMLLFDATPGASAISVAQAAATVGEGQ